MEPNPCAKRLCQPTIYLFYLLWNTMDYSLPGSPVHGNSPGKNTGVGCHSLLQWIFLTQGLNPGLPYCRQILYCVSHQEGPQLKWMSI